VVGGVVADKADGEAAAHKTREATWLRRLSLRRADRQLKREMGWCEVWERSESPGSPEDAKQAIVDGESASRT
jgi:hypothetical protein